MAWEREIRRLRVTIRMLSAVLVAVLARMVIDRPTPVTVVTGALLTVILAGALGLARRMRELEPEAPPADVRRRRQRR